jgi:hypothetical protein
MTAQTKFEHFVEDLVKGVHLFQSHTFKVALTNSAPTAATGAVLADITQIGAGNGYSTGGTASTVTLSRTGGTEKISWSNVTFTASGGSIGPFRYPIFYNDTPTSPADPLISYSDYGSNLTLNDGDTFTVSFSVTDGFAKLT